MKKHLFVLLIPFILQCSAAAPYGELQSLLTSETVFSRTADVSVSVPVNWFSAEDNETNTIDLWLIENDYKATLNLYRLNLNSGNVDQIRAKGLQQLVQIMKSVKRAENGTAAKFSGQEEFFNFLGRDYGMFSFSTDSRKVNSVVFELSGRFYELSLITAPGIRLEQNEWEKFLKVQKAVLLSIK